MLSAYFQVAIIRLPMQHRTIVKVTIVELLSMYRVSSKTILLRTHISLSNYFFFFNDLPDQIHKSKVYRLMWQSIARPLAKTKRLTSH